MSRVEKVIEKMRNQPKGIRPEEAEKVLLSLGYYVDNQRGSHRQYRHKTKAPFTLVWENPVERYLIKEILTMVDEA